VLASSSPSEEVVEAVVVRACSSWMRPGNCLDGSAVAGVWIDRVFIRCDALAHVIRAVRLLVFCSSALARKRPLVDASLPEV
jgi:hypothetical protein